MSQQYILFRLLASWCLDFRFIQNVKYTYYKKFIEVYVCQNFSNRLRFDKVIREIIWCSFPTWYIVQSGVRIGRMRLVRC